MAEVLLANNADVNAKDSLGSTPLHHAASSDSRGVVKLLLASNADVNAKDIMGGTPLRGAEEYGRQFVAALLCAHGGR